MRPKTRAIVLGAALVTGAAVAGIDWNQYIQKRYPNGSPVPPVINTKQTTLSGGTPLPVSCASGNVSSCMATANQNLLVSACKGANVLTPQQGENNCQPAQNMTLSNNYINYELPLFEGDIHHYYNDTGCNCTAGIGHLVHLGACQPSLATIPSPPACIPGHYGNGFQFPGKHISNTTIVQWEKSDLSSAINLVKSSFYGQIVTQHEFNSLVDIAYNGGPYAIDKVAMDIKENKLNSAIIYNTQRGEKHGVQETRISYENSGLSNSSGCS